MWTCCKRGNYSRAKRLKLCPSGGMADATDLKSVIRKGVWVRVPPRVPIDLL